MFSGGATTPGLVNSIYLAGIVGMAAIGYLAITTAMRMGDVGAITLLRYTRIVFAMAIGVLVFDERLDTWTLVGTGIVIGSGLFTIYREHRAQKRA